MLFDDSGYEFLTYDNRRQQWRSISEDDALGARKLPDGLDLRLTVEARPVVLKRPADAKDKTPQVTIFSNGDLTTFEAILERDGGMRSITVAEDDTGDVIERPMVEVKKPMKRSASQRGVHPDRGAGRARHRGGGHGGRHEHPHLLGEHAQLSAR